MEELWKGLVGLENRYEVSSLGKFRIKDYWYYNSRGIHQHIPERIVNGTFDKDKYLRVSIIGKTTRLHRVVAEAFIPNPENKPCVNHKNGIKTDNRVENLEWCTVSENNIHAYRSGIKVSPRGVNMYNAKLTERQVMEVRKKLADGWRNCEISRLMGIGFKSISEIKTNKKWKHIQITPQC